MEPIFMTSVFVFSVNIIRTSFDASNVNRPCCQCISTFASMQRLPARSTNESSSSVDLRMHMRMPHETFL